jgi:hypothetical protein
MIFRVNNASYDFALGKKIFPKIFRKAVFLYFELFVNPVFCAKTLKNYHSEHCFYRYTPVSLFISLHLSSVPIPLSPSSSLFSSLFPHCNFPPSLSPPPSRDQTWIYPSSPPPVQNHALHSVHNSGIYKYRTVPYLLGGATTVHCCTNIVNLKCNVAKR